MLMLLPKCVMTHAPGEWHEAAGAPDFAKLSAERCPGALEWLSRKAGPLPVIKLSASAAEPDLGCRRQARRSGSTQSRCVQHRQAEPLPLARENATYRCLFGEEMMGSSTDAQKSTEAFARRAEQEAKRDAIVKARLQAEADSIDAKTMRLRALRTAQERRGPGPIDRI